MRLKILFSLLICILSIQQVFCQKFKSSTEVKVLGGGGNNKLYANYPNSLIISSEIYFNRDLKVTVSQGRLDSVNVVQNTYNAMYFLSNLKTGKVTVTVTKKSDNKIILARRSFTVTNKPLTKEEKNALHLSEKPKITLKGFEGGDIPVILAKAATKFEITEGYQITNVVVSLIGKSGTDPAIFPLTSQDFDDNLKTSWKWVKPQTTIILDEIKVKDVNGKVYALKEILFKVTE
jgi:hypothetical protein